MLEDWGLQWGFSWFREGGGQHFDPLPLAWLVHDTVGHVSLIKAIFCIPSLLAIGWLLPFLFLVAIR